MYLKGTSDVLRLNVATAGSDIEATISWADALDGSPPVVSSFGREVFASITASGNTTLLTGVASHTLKPKRISVFNNHATVASRVYLDVTDGTDTVIVAGSDVNLLAGESLLMTEAGTFIHYDSNGAEYPATGNAASQAEMEAATATDRFVTPQGVNWHPGVAKCWGKAVGAGTSLTVNWNITSVTDTGTGRLGVNIGTDFSSANYAILASLERSVTALTATGVEDHAIRNASPTAGVFEIESYDQTATTFVAQDPANYFWACFGDQ
jgi:hypothetical protein